MSPTRGRHTLDLHVTLDSRRDMSAGVYRQIREAIVAGRLRAGEALPSSRELARRLQVSRNTVVFAYERLRAEGFLTSRIGAGTFVSDGFRPVSSTPSAESPIRPRPLWDAIPEGPDMAATKVEFDFRPGIPDVRHFPLAAWRSRLARQLRRTSIGSGAHIGAAGDPALRAAIARHIGVSRGVSATAEDVFVTSGSQQAIDLVARVLLEPGQIVAVEEPGYPLPRRAFHVHGCRVTAVPVDDEGIIVDALPDAARLVYVTPSHQYPLGMTMSLERRQALLAWADRNDATVLEDDYDSEFRYGGRPLETLRSLDGSGRVLYVGSFSKVMLPTLRLGFLVAPPPLHAALRKAKHLADWHTAVPLQAAAARFIDDGLLAQHIRRMRRIYAERHERITALLAHDFASWLLPLPAVCGLHLSTVFRPTVKTADTEIARRALDTGVAVHALSYHYLHGRAQAGLLFGYGAIATDRIETGLHRLRACFG